MLPQDAKIKLFLFLGGNKAHLTRLTQFQACGLSVLLSQNISEHSCHPINNSFQILFNELLKETTLQYTKQL